jgi:hypothetical protein
MPWSRLRRVNEAYNAHPKSKLSLLHAFAQVAQMNPAIYQMKQILRFYRLILEKS